MIAVIAWICHDLPSVHDLRCSQKDKASNHMGASHGMIGAMLLQLVGAQVSENMGGKREGI